MADIYYCKQENNNCPKKEICKRYIEAEGKSNATLFKYACTENNNYILFIEAEMESNKENGKEEQ